MKNQKEVKVKPQEPVIVTGTGLSQYLSPDKEYELHRVAADKLIARGLAQRVA